jgi:hypothetical protein
VCLLYVYGVIPDVTIIKLLIHVLLSIVDDLFDPHPTLALFTVSQIFCIFCIIQCNFKFISLLFGLGITGRAHSYFLAALLFPKRWTQAIFQSGPRRCQ